MRKLTSSGDPRAAEAIESVHVSKRPRRFAAMANTLEGLECLVFTGGIGANAAEDTRADLSAAALARSSSSIPTPMKRARIMISRTVECIRSSGNSDQRRNHDGASDPHQLSVDRAAHGSRRRFAAPHPKAPLSIGEDLLQIQTCAEERALARVSKDGPRAPRSGGCFPRSWPTAARAWPGYAAGCGGAC